MPQYDDSFLDSPLFRRRAKSYCVLKQDVPDAKTFQITATPFLLEITNYQQNVLPSTSTFNFEGNLTKKKIIAIFP